RYERHSAARPQQLQSLSSLRLKRGPGRGGSFGLPVKKIPPIVAAVSLLAGRIPAENEEARGKFRCAHGRTLRPESNLRGTGRQVSRRCAERAKQAPSPCAGCGRQGR